MSEPFEIDLEYDNLYMLVRGNYTQGRPPAKVDMNNFDATFCDPGYGSEIDLSDVTVQVFGVEFKLYNKQLCELEANESFLDAVEKEILARK